MSTLSTIIKLEPKTNKFIIEEKPYFLKGCAKINEIYVNGNNLCMVVSGKPTDDELESIKTVMIDKCTNSPDFSVYTHIILDPTNNVNKLSVYPSFIQRRGRPTEEWVKPWVVDIDLNEDGSEPTYMISVPGCSDKSITEGIDKLKVEARDKIAVEILRLTELKSNIYCMPNDEWES